MRNTIQTVAGAALAFVLCFTATAWAAGTVSPDDGSLLDLIKPVYEAIMHGNLWLAAALAVVLLTAATRRYLPDAWGGKYARGDVGGMLTAFLLSFAGAVATTMAAPGAVMSGMVMLAALKIGGFAVGGFVALHKLATAFVASSWFQTKAPAWLRTVLGTLLALIGSSAIAKAEAAGNKAVDNTPAGGITSVVGVVKEVE